MADAAASVGMDADEVRAHLAGDAGAASVRAQLARATDVGVSAVPCYLLAGKFAIPGAQSSDVMAQFIERAKERL